ncbi:ABC-type transporter, integral membrane subunit [Rhizobium sp. CF080]|uniref:FecCD family ABC transporter permease n=1 Tax=Rhizobium sp. (strain CF080) TaxID=1144310 RepID=UPI0002715E93|nr:iron chelate uptake ABC transporter family permease subunit [Rhizobium sp. CF080]EUB99512.1 ABC-type transporter, integral membrane subunit [Rhizobium sp. CF080]
MQAKATEQPQPGYPPQLVVRSTQTVRISLRRRLLARCLLLALVVVLLGSFGLANGRVAVSFLEIVSAMTGTADQRIALVVMEWRLPRVLAALVCGAGLGVAGALFQSLTRNPLGSPDILGFDAGAQTGVLVMLSRVGTGFASMATGAAIGSFATALAVGLLSVSRRGLPRLRFIVVGIGIAAMLNAANAWLMLTVDLQTAMSAAGWRAGSLTEIDGPVLIAALPPVLPLLALAACLAPSLRQLEVGDELAIAFGIRPGLIRAGAVLVGIGLTATVSAIAGPITFLALVAPQLARFATGHVGLSIIAPATMGALLLLAADTAARLCFPNVQMPIGALTASMGGIYLIWLLGREARRGRGS